MNPPEHAEPVLPQSVAANDFDAAWALAEGDERFRESHRSLLAGFPDLRLDLQWKDSAANNTMVRARIQGTHRGEWRGIAPTGRSIDVFGIVTLQVDGQGAVVDLWLTSNWPMLAKHLGA
jgi:predicted ester cyclase